MSPQAVQPLRIQKSTPTSSPTKMSSRPLSELGPTERRRNSPSFNQATKRVLFTQNSSPFDTSPLNGTNRMASPRLFWQGRDPASSPSRFDSENSGNRDGSPSPTRRSSIENLKRASRVKNSNMFAREQKQEYNPASIPVVERPLANGRPLTVQGNAFGGRGFDSFRKETSSPLVEKLGTDSDGISKASVASPTKTPAKPSNDAESSAETPSKDNVSPIKSSLSTPGRYHALPRSFDPENGTWSGDESGGEYQLPPGRVLHRHAKSVTFDAAPPQVNEYEMGTPDLSSIGTSSPHAGYDSAEDDEDDESFDRGGYIDRDDSFDASLEDTEKTPVVGPEAWRQMSPGLASDRLSEDIEDPFVGRDGSPMPAAKPSSSVTGPDHIHTRTDSVNSNGERRPLPPIPGFGTPSPTRANSTYGNLSATAERVSSAQRGLPAPPRPASISKSDVQSMEGSKMSLEERLRLMMLQDDEGSKTSSETQRERRLRRSRSGSRARSQSQEPEPDHEPKGLGIQVNAEERHAEEQAAEDDYKLPPRISRESILRRVKSRSQIFEDTEHDCSTPSPPSSPGRGMAINLDPDVPIQSTEPPSYLEDTESSVVIKQEEGESEYFDVYSIPEIYGFDLVERLADHESQEGASAYPQVSGDDDGESHYSDENEQSQLRYGSEPEEDGPATPRPSIPTRATGNVRTPEELQSHRMSLPEFASLLGAEDFGLGLRSYMTPTPPLGTLESAAIQTGTVTEDFGDRPITPEGQPSILGYEFDSDEGRKTPDSVIRHTVESPKEDSPFVPEPVATIKAPGGRLKTRPSATPADMASMAAARRQVSGEQPPTVPPIPERHRDHRYPSREPEDVTNTEEEDSDGQAGAGRELNHKRSLKRLDIPVGDVGEDLSFGLDKEFDRLIEAQKVAYDLSSDRYRRWGNYMIGNQEVGTNVAMRPQRGYLMRQNTKLIVASSNTDENVTSNADLEESHGRETRSAGNSPRKASHDRTKSWSVEPWNGKARRRSVRDASNARKRPNGVAPPLPGMESNVTSGLDNVTEDEPAGADEAGGERGRVFVKVVGVKDLDLPLPKGERTWFCLTLDNGLHCVTTAWLELGRNAPIGQEFELVVLNDLEFQLTLQTKIEPPPVRPAQQSPVKAAKVQKQSTFSRVFASPRKRKELERKQQEEERMSRQQQEAQSKVASQPTAWDLLHRLVARDGSFARSYVCLKDYESRAYGRQIVTDVTCFNEWATEEVIPSSSVKSKRGANSTLQRRPPYHIGKLELQLLFVPKPQGVKSPDMPKSMNACIREMREADASAASKWEGHLSQQGGDCPFWRRRFFKLEGSKLTAYHETTRQPRATINLAKASKLIDDRSSLIQKEFSAKGGRRKSAFAEEEEGYMFVEEGFRLRFANGEVIDFYADSPAAKEEWMRVLGDTIGKEPSAKGWTGMVLAKEKAERDRAGKQGGLANTPGRKPPPPPPVEKGPRQHHGHRSKGSVGSLQR
ncbi:MAG: Bud site selection protein bud4 [Geoglossum umbratile]|nr:MAG: Bud site selection protein bud4 [Geoglossum umbratile]